MRHRKKVLKLGRTLSHNRCMVANMLKSLIYTGRITTTVGKAKKLQPHAERLVTLAKKNTLSSRRRAIQKLMIRYNRLTPKQARLTKEGNVSACNQDRLVIRTLFNQLGPRFEQRQGGYTRLVRTKQRIGDNAPMCVLEYLQD